MVNKNYKYAATCISVLALYVRHPKGFAGYAYEDAKNAPWYANGFVICKNAMQSELLNSLWGKPW